MIESQSTLERSLKAFSTAVGKLGLDGTGDDYTAKSSNEVIAKSGDNSTSKGPAIKRQKIIKDPDQPKKPTPAYLRFQSAVRDSVKSSLPADATNGEVLKAVGEKWKGLDEAGRKPWTDQQKQETIDYETKIALYKQQHGDVQKSRPSEAKALETLAEDTAETDDVDSSDDEAAAASLHPVQVATPSSERAEKSKKKKSRKSELAVDATEVLASPAQKANEKK